MRKLFSIVISALLMFSFAVAEGEITFKNIPWLSDETTVIQTLTEAGLVKNGGNSSISQEDKIYIIVDDTDFASPDRVIGADDATYAVDLTEIIKGKIADYPLKNLILTFAYDGEYKLIAVKVELIKGNYDDLKAKLTKVYGEGEHKETEEGIWSTVWKGDNNTAVLLYSDSEGLDYTLMYGRLDAAEILSNCLAPADPDDVSGL